MNWKDIAVRAVKTFVQSFVAILLASQIGSLADLLNPTLLDQAAVAGVAALLSFVQNVLNSIDVSPKGDE